VDSFCVSFLKTPSTLYCRQCTRTRWCTRPLTIGAIVPEAPLGNGAVCRPAVRARAAGGGGQDGCGLHRATHHRGRPARLAQLCATGARRHRFVIWHAGPGVCVRARRVPVSVRVQPHGGLCAGMTKDVQPGLGMRHRQPQFDVIQVTSTGKNARWLPRIYSAFRLTHHKLDVEGKWRLTVMRAAMRGAHE
jgi:hypothetical protein